MQTLELKADIREATGRRAKGLRQDGLVPAVLYGHTDSALLQINAKDLGKVLREAGTYQLISLHIGDRKKPVTAMARDIQRDVLRHDYLHVDFYAVKMDEKVVAQVPIIVEGTSPAVKELGGVLTQGLDELEVECLPSDLISSVEVNIDGLTELNDTISVSELTVPKSITILSDPESMVIKIEPPRLIEEEEEEEEEVLGEVSAEPEVITAREEEEAE